jgi:glycosyltransferase involved in cell wall biosynthesis
LESLKIALIYELGPADDGSFLGGIESHILGLAKQLAREHEVTLMTGMIPGARARTEMDGFTLIRSDALGLVARSWDPTNLTNQRQLFCIPSFLRQGAAGIKADLFHGHVYASGLVALGLAGLRRSHSVNTIHGSYYDHWRTITGSELKSIGYQSAERILATFLARRCDRQIHTATDFAEKVKGWGGPQDRIRVILNGVDTERFSPSVEPQQVASGKPLVMTVRRLVPKNGVRYFVEASRHVDPPADFVIVGDGPERSSLEKLSRDLGVSDRVSFMGPVPNNRLPGLLAAADVLVVPSLVEASSISLLEAMAMGKPAVVTNIPGIDEVASPDRSMMVPPANSRALGEAIDLLLKDPARHRALSQKGREYVVSQRSEEVMARQTLSIYREALEN